jgi:hypothetical protein
MFGITGPNQGDRAGVAKDLPVTFGALDRGGRGCTFERLARHEAIIGPVDGHRNELSKICHDVSLTFFLREMQSSADALTQVNRCCAARAKLHCSRGGEPVETRQTSLKHWSAANMIRSVGA